MNQNDPMNKILRKNLMLLIIAVSPWLTYPTAKADTMARVFPITNQVMITLYRNRLGGSDSDAKNLFEAMNVPVQDTMLGPGKSIEDSTKALSWVCGDKGKDGYQCTFMFKKSAATRVRTSPIEVEYKITGPEAQSLFDRIHFNLPNGNFEFRNEEGTFDISMSALQTVIQYRE